MAVALTYTSNVTAQETISTMAGAASDAHRMVTHDGYDQTKFLNATSTPPVSDVASGEQAMTAGAATLNLASIAGGRGATKDFTGLKIQTAKLRNKSTNAAVITISEGASNGYALLGASWTIKLLPGQEITIYGNDATPDVAAADRTIDIAGTGTEILEYHFTAG